MSSDAAYYLFLADLKGSSVLPTDQATEMLNHVQDKLDDLEQRFDNSLALGPALNYGDEIAALFHKPDPLYQVVSELRDVLRPYVPFRFVVNYGPIGALSDDITQTGGAIFKEADEAIRKLKSRSRFCKWMIGNTQKSNVLNSLTELTNLMISDMTDNQYEVYKYIRQDMQQKQIAEMLGKSAQAISKTVKRSHIEELLDAEHTINAYLSAIEGEE